MADYEEDSDGMPREIVGGWALTKYRLLEGYVDASRAARARMGGTPCFVDLYCGPGRARIRDTGTVVDGGTVAGLRAAMRTKRGKAHPFQRVYVGDVEASNVDACVSRLDWLCSTPIVPLVGEAETTVRAVVQAIPRHGLHLAYLDPYALFALPFSIIQALASVPNVDLLIHFAASDMTRNLQRPDLLPRFDPVAPGWRNAVTKSAGKSARRRLFFEHWKSAIRSLGYHVDGVVRSVENTKGREIYRLVLASKHPLGSKIWDSLRDGNPQTTLW